MRALPKILSTTALTLALSLGAASTALAETDFAFGSLSAQTQDHVTVFVGSDGTMSGAAESVNEKTDGRLEAASCGYGLGQ